jgi:hypothetical protein
VPAPLLSLHLGGRTRSDNGTNTGAELDDRKLSLVIGENSTCRL